MCGAASGRNFKATWLILVFFNKVPNDNQSIPTTNKHSVI